MPHTTEQWWWFWFFTGGSIGGWVELIKTAVEFVIVAAIGGRFLYRKWKVSNA